MTSKSIYKPEYQILVSLLKESRKKISGMTQARLAEELNRPQSYVSNVERGRRRLDVLELRAHCKACGQSLSSFIRKFEAAVAKTLH